MRFLLAFFFFLMYAGNDLGLNVGLAPGLSVKNLLLYLILAGIAVNAAVAQNRKIELPAVMVMFGLLILYAFVTWVTLSFVLQDPEYEVLAGFVSLKSSLIDQFLTFLIFFYGLLHLKDAQWLLRSIVWIAMLGNLITIIDTMNIPDLGLLPDPRKGGRFEGFIGQPNAYGQFLALFLPACVVLFLQERRRIMRALAALGVLSTVLALVLTASRGAYLGVLAGAVLGAFYLRRQISTQAAVRTGVVAGVLCGLVLAITFAAGYSDLYLDRFSGMEGTVHVATSGRSSLWSNALSSMMENPVTFISGYGFHSYDSSRSFRLSTHNMYLSYLYNLGAIGLFLFVMIFARIMAAARAAMAAAHAELRVHFIAFAFGVFSFLITIFFSDYHESGYLLWAYVGVMMRAAMNTEYVDDADPVPAEASLPAARREQAAGGYASRWARGDIKVR